MSETKEVRTVTSPAATSLLGVIAQAAANPEVNVEKMLALLDMQERILAREAKVQFSEAMRQINEEDLRVAKDGTVKLGKDGKESGSYKFARWEDMDELIRPLLRRAGMWLSFDSQQVNNGLKVIGRLNHEAGHSETASIQLFQDNGPGRNPNQAMGSAISYGKRYTTEMLLNIVRADADDDAASSLGPDRPSEPRPVRQKAEPDRRPVLFATRAATALENEPNGTVWMKTFERFVAEAATLDDLASLRALESFKATQLRAPTLIKARIEELLHHAYDRLAVSQAIAEDKGQGPAFNGNGHAEGENRVEGVANMVNQAVAKLKVDEDTKAADDDGWPGPR